MKILRMAWRNVFRHTRRTVITAAAISVGLAAMIFMNTMMNGVDNMASSNIIDYESSEITIFTKGYYREEGFFPLDEIIEAPEFIAQKLKGVQGVKDAVGRVKFEARISDGVDELPVLGIGIDIGHEEKVFKTRNAVVKGRYLASNDGLLIGTELAGDMGLDVDSFVTVITRNRNGTYDAYDFTVTGLINTGHPLFDRNAVLLPLEVAQQLLDIGAGVTEYNVKIANAERAPQIKEEIAGTIGENYEVYTWKELNASVFQISGFKRTVQFMVVLVVVVIAAVGIINTMLMAVMERIPEIGTMKAMGFGNFAIVRMFLYEGGIIGIFGSLFGCIVGFVLSLYLVWHGLDFSRFFEGMDIIYPMKFVVKGEIDYLMILYVFIFGIIVSVLATLFPVRGAARLKPVDALRHT
jgi:ABC-type lipoprotein release transport system permease subunit